MLQFLHLSLDTRYESELEEQQRQVGKLINLCSKGQRRELSTFEEQWEFKLGWDRVFLDLKDIVNDGSAIARVVVLGSRLRGDRKKFLGGFVDAELIVSHDHLQQSLQPVPAASGLVLALRHLQDLAKRILIVFQQVFQERFELGVPSVDGPRRTRSHDFNAVLDVPEVEPAIRLSHFPSTDDLGRASAFYNLQLAVIAWLVEQQLTDEVVIDQLRLKGLWTAQSGSQRMKSGQFWVDSLDPRLS